MTNANEKSPKRKNILGFIYASFHPRKLDLRQRNLKHYTYNKI